MKPPLPSFPKCLDDIAANAERFIKASEAAQRRQRWNPVWFALLNAVTVAALIYMLAVGLPPWCFVLLGALHGFFLGKVVVR